MKSKGYPGCLGFFFFGDEILPSYVMIIINHEIRIPIEQPWKVSGRFFFGITGSTLFTAEDPHKEAQSFRDAGRNA